MKVIFDDTCIESAHFFFSLQSKRGTLIEFCCTLPLMISYLINYAIYFISVPRGGHVESGPCSPSTGPSATISGLQVGVSGPVDGL